MNTVFFSAPAGISEEATSRALSQLQVREGDVGMVVFVNKPGSSLCIGWTEFTPKEEIKMDVRRWGGNAFRVANSIALSRYQPDIALVCPGQKEENDVIARSIDAGISVMLFNFDGEIETELTRESFLRWLQKQ